MRRSYGFHNKSRYYVVLELSSRTMSGCMITLLQQLVSVRSPHQQYCTNKYLGILSIWGLGMSGSDRRLNTYYGGTNIISRYFYLP